MNKFNLLGQEILELKEALNQPQTQIIYKSLTQLADKLLEQQLIEQETHYLLTEPSFPFEEFKSFCLEKPSLMKTDVELLKEYEEKRIALVETLNECMENYQLTSESYLDKECIMLIKTFYFGEKETMDYFGVNMEDCEGLLRRKGFIERFATLRLKKVLTDFLSEKLMLIDTFVLNTTPVFYDEEYEAYAIDLVFEISLETLANTPNEDFIKPIQEVLETIVAYYDQRFIA